MSSPCLQREKFPLTQQAISEKIKAQIPRILSAGHEEPHYDPIIQDLMKINPTPLALSDREDDQTQDAGFETSIPQYSFQLAELLDFLLNQKLDDSSRMEYEANLTELISILPVLLTDKQSRKFPDDHLSRVLIDNCLNLLKLASLYFNLSLSSQVTKFLVKTIYKLECWEIYHLLQIIPDFECFLKLVDIEVTTTPFGHIVKPPENFLGFNLRQGFQYPFPFPFYNFSYHTPDPYSSARKYAKISIDNYIDIRLKKTPKRRRRPRSWPKLPKAQEDEHEMRNLSSTEGMLHSPPILRSQGTAKLSTDGTNDFQKHQKVFIFMEMSPAQILNEQEVYNREGDDEDDEYDTDEANAIMAEEKEAMELSTNPGEKFIIVSSAYERVLQDAEQKGLAKLTTLHQCRLLDPSTQQPCLKIFYGKNELQRHQEFVHATTKKIYKCAYCEASGNKQQSYPRHDSLARHIRRKHGITGRENKMAVNLAKKNAEVLDGLLQSAGVSSSHTGAERGLADGSRASVESSVGPPESRSRGMSISENVSAAPPSESSSPTKPANPHSNVGSSSSALRSPPHISQPPALANVHKGYNYDPHEVHQAGHDVNRGTGIYMPQQAYKYPPHVEGGHGSGPLSMHGTSNYPLPQYAKFTPWSVPPPLMLASRGQMDTKMDPAGVSRQSPPAPMMQGFQKFRFPNNYQPIGMQSPYGPMYGQEGVFYSVPPMQGQIPQPAYMRSVVSQPSQHQRQTLQPEQEQLRQQQKQHQQQQQEHQQQMQPQNSPQQESPRGLPTSPK